MKNKLLIILKKIFQYSKDQYNYRIRYLTTLVRFQKNPGEKEKPITIYTLEMFGKFIDKAANEFEKTLFMTFFYSGIRVGELRALRWTDINFEKITINIERQVTSKVRMNRNIIMTSKSESSIREIIIPTVLNEQLKKWKTSRMELGGFKNKWNVFGDYSFVT